MTLKALTVGVHRVRIGQHRFNLSVMSNGVKGVAAFEVGQSVPRKGKHFLITENVRQWIEAMEKLQDNP